MKNYIKILSVMVMAVLFYELTADTAKQQPVTIADKLHEIFKHSKIQQYKAKKSLKEIQEDSHDAIARMEKSLEAIKALEAKYKGLLSKDAKQTLAEFKQMIIVSMASHA